MDERLRNARSLRTASHRRYHIAEPTGHHAQGALACDRACDATAQIIMGRTTG